MRRPAEDARRLQLLEPRRQDVARDAGQPRGELAVAARPDEQVADDEQRPALADQLEGLGDAAVLPVVACGHRRSGLLVRVGLGALRGGDRVHPAELEGVAVRVVERALVHEAVVRGLPRLGAARGDAGGDGLVDRPRGCRGRSRPTPTGSLPGRRSAAR